MMRFEILLNRYRQLQAVKSENGFTFVELLVAMVMLILIVFAFTPLLVGSIERIHFAGDKSEALYQGQSDIEVDIAERNTVDGYELVFTFGDTEIIVPGGLVEAEKTEGKATAWLSGFVPFVPSINLYLAPLPLVEGYDPTPIVVMGKSTDFELAKYQNENINFYDKSGAQVSGHSYPLDIIVPPDGVPDGYETLPGNYDEYAKFTLAEGLTNSKSIYRLTLNWTIENDITVVVRSRLQVVLPYAVAVGGGQRVWISPNARETWKEKTQIGAGLGTLNDIIWTGFEFVAVTSSGRIVVWRDGQEMNVTAPDFGNLNAAAYGRGSYTLVGNGGLILNSTDTNNWNTVSSSGSDLLAVGWSDYENKFVAVGNGGTILSSADGTSWIDESPSDAGDVTFKGIAYGGSQWLAVGNNAGTAVIYSSSGGTWGKIDLLSEAVNGEATILELPGLNDVTHDRYRFIVVGDVGTIMTSENGTGWKVIDPGTNNNLYAVDWGDIADDTDHYIIVGAVGTIITWTGNTEQTWVIQNTGISQDIFGVAVRWTK